MIPIFKPSIIRKDMDAVLTCMVEECFGNGETTKEFQKKAAKMLSVNSVTGLLEPQRSFELLLDMYEIEKGSRIALSPLSPWWYHTLLQRNELVPVYVDINQDSCTIDPVELQSIEDKADLLFVYHNLGYETPTAEVEESGVTVIEDISEVLAGRLASENRIPARAGVFRLDEKGYFAGLGGSYVFVRERKDMTALKKQTAILDDSQLVTDIQTSLSSSQFSLSEKYRTRRNEIREIFLSSLLKSKNRTFAVDDEIVHVPYSFPVVLNSGSRDVFAYAKKKKIMCSQAFGDSVIARFPEEVQGCPGARALSLRCVLFPLYPSLSSGDVNLIAKVLSTLP